MEIFAENLKKIRQELRYTADEMADMLGVKPRTYGSWERKEAVPSMELGLLLMKKLNIDLNWFVSGEGSMYIKNNGSSLKEEIKAAVKEMFSSGELDVFIERSRGRKQF